MVANMIEIGRRDSHDSEQSSAGASVRIVSSQHSPTWSHATLIHASILTKERPHEALKVGLFNVNSIVSPSIMRISSTARGLVKEGL